MSARYSTPDDQEKVIGKNTGASTEKPEIAKTGKAGGAAAQGDDPAEEAGGAEIPESAAVTAEEIEEAAGAEAGGEALLLETEQLKDQLLRLTADFDNFRKRTMRDKQDWSRYASQSIIEKLIPVIDNLDAAALATAGAGQEVKNVAEGFLMIQKQLMDVLNREGLTEIPAQGEMFDPNIHEAVMTVSPTEDQEDNRIVMVMRKGYMYKDKILRPSMVQVAKD